MKQTSVLIIEDDPDSAEAIALMLEGLGCQTCVAHNRDVAVLLLQRCQPDTILMDYMMPGMSAAAFIAYTRIYHPAAKIILMSASTNPRAIAAALGADAYFAKPLDFVRLRAFLFERPAVPR